MQLQKAEWCEAGAGIFLPPNSQNTITDTNEQSEMGPELVYKNPQYFGRCHQSVRVCPYLSVFVRVCSCLFVSVRVCPCLSVFVRVRPCPSSLQNASYHGQRS